MPAGQRVAVDGAVYYAEPCGTAPLGTLDACATVDITGRPSACGDGQCWLEALVGGAPVWIADTYCDGSVLPVLAQPGDPACPAA